MSHVDGADVARTLELEADVVVVGSGPAGSSAARELARGGARVVVIEEGPWSRPEDAPLSAFGAMSELYRDMGSSVVLGAAPIPYLQGRMVGGSSPINGAICWRMPRDVWDAWCAEDPSLRDALPWDELETLTDEIEARLGVAPTDASVAGRKNLLMAAGADALGLAHRPIRRNVRGCTGSGRCLQGCPHGFKQSADVTLLADALAHGTTLVSRAEAREIVHRDGRAHEIRGRAAGGGAVRIRARHAVVLAASAVQTPALLLGNRITHGPVGENFQCHPGVSLAGRFREPVRMWEGATQGHEVTGLRHEGLKLEVLGFDLTVLAARLDGVGRELAHRIADMAHWLDWGAAVRAEARGRVRRIAGRTVVTWTPSAADVRRFRRGLRVMGEMMLAAGAEEVHPGVRGFAPRVTSRAVLEDLEHDGPSRPAAYTAAITHMFGTCRMGRDRHASVVRPDFRHHAIDGLWIADSSVFPTSLGVNPQVPIMAVAALCARRVLAAAPGARLPSPSGASVRPGTDPRRVTLDALLAMDARELHALVARAHPLDLAAIADTQYQGIDLSLPRALNRVLWKTFRKTFHRDPATGGLRGWNVRMEQTGIEGPRIAMRRRDGAARTFAHYEVRSADGLRFPRGWRGAHYLDYGVVGNPRGEALAYTPLVAVNEGDMELLLGWEVLKLGPLLVPLPDYWVLRREGPLQEVVPLPRARRA